MRSAVNFVSFLMPAAACSVMKGLHETSSASRPAPGHHHLNYRSTQQAQEDKLKRAESNECSAECWMLDSHACSYAIL